MTDSVTLSYCLLYIQAECIELRHIEHHAR